MVTINNSEISPSPSFPGIAKSLCFEPVSPKAMDLLMNMIDNAGMIPYNETPPNNPASSKATRNISGKEYAKITGGPRASAAAKTREFAFPNRLVTDSD
mmetsp:Transcript_23560/g.48324  ORF Transcript_23560/g.48324 Transcript_23560/m.48324 type:complete len:99 (-) Transcript_23560:286-582(-)